MGLVPEKYLSVKLSTARDSYSPGDPIEVEATLTNISDLDIPLGPSGLCNAVLKLQVNLDSGQEFTHLPALVWPAKRFLKAGESITASARIDVGPLEENLVRRPLDKIALRIAATLDSLERNGQTTSMLPTMEIKPARCTRSDILVAFDRERDDWEKAYDLTLGYIVRDLKKGDVPDRMLAARKIASLLTLVADVQLGRATLPHPLAAKVRQPVLLSMLRATLEDPSPAVRAEMLSSLIYCRPDSRLLTLVRPAMDDKSEMVRFRLVELLGVAGQLESSPFVGHFAADTDPWVKRMTEVFK